MSEDAYNNQLQRISTDLKLIHFNQDWGIGNSDFNRVGEFLQYFVDEHHALDDFVKCELVELVIASFNELLIECQFDKKAEKQFNQFTEILANKYLCQKTLEYWKNISLHNEFEFPIGRLLH